MTQGLSLRFVSTAAGSLTWTATAKKQKPLKKTIAEYLKSNVLVTNSGVAWEPAVKFCQQVMGEDRVMYAMDYPYQYLPQEVHDMDAMDISAETKKKFFQTNAERWFKL